MKTFLLRLIRRTDGSQLLPYTLVGERSPCLF